MNEPAVEIHIVRGKEAIKIMRKEFKQVRRNRKLKRLIQEVRKLRRELANK